MQISRISADLHKDNEAASVFENNLIREISGSSLVFGLDTKICISVDTFYRDGFSTSLKLS